MNFWKIVQGGYEFVRTNPFFNWLPSTVSNEITPEAAYYAVVTNELPLDGSRSITLSDGSVIDKPVTWFTIVFRVAIVLFIILILFWLYRKLKNFLS